MKKILASAALAFITLALAAVPAKQGVIKYTQPDGSIILIVRHGDEFCNWTTDTAGNTLVMDSEGFYRRALTKAHAGSVNSQRKASGKMNANGEKKFPVLLIQFSDQSFRFGKEAFADLLNKEGYNNNGGTGSARDYFMENSSKKFSPAFDVYGPYTVSGKLASYGGDASNAGKLLYEALKLADSEIDFSQYDNDSDGTVDNVFFFYAGYNRAEGGSEITIWPHHSAISATGKFDGKTISDYSCTSELKGSAGSGMCGIGIFCHEFGHALGLPDLYDTNGSTDGEGDGMGRFSLMNSGNYNNEGRTPPYLTAIERTILGWMDEPATLSSGTISLKGIQNNTAYRIPTTNDGEYFLLESRDGTGWDKYITGYGSTTAKGLLLTHIDKSQNLVNGKTAASLWESGIGLNLNSLHQCCYVVPSNFDKYISVVLAEGTTHRMDYPIYAVFPGESGIVTLDYPTLAEWSGGATGYSISDIKFDGTLTSFDVIVNRERTISGTVKDADGKAIAGAAVVICDESCATRAMGTPVISGEDGSYTIDIEATAGSKLTLRVYKSGYQEFSRSFQMEGGNKTVDVVLSAVKATDYSGLGIRSINNPLPGYSIGSTFELSVVSPEGAETPIKTAWTCDGKGVEGASILLDEARDYTIAVVLTYENGDTETLTCVIRAI